jgi:hypothetical protein
MVAFDTQNLDGIDLFMEEIEQLSASELPTQLSGAVACAGCVFCAGSLSSIGSTGSSFSSTSSFSTAS